VGINESSINVQTSMLVVEQPVSNPYASSGVFGVLGISITQNPENFFWNAYQNGQFGSSSFALSLQPNNETSYLYLNSIPSSILDQTISILSVDGSLSALSVIGFQVNGK
jgi:hypothetical protein